MIYYICSGNKKQIKKYSPLNKKIIKELALNNIYKIDIRYQKAIRIFYFYKCSKSAEKLAITYIIENFKYYKKIVDIVKFIRFILLDSFLNSDVEKNIKNLNLYKFFDYDIDKLKSYLKSDKITRMKLACLQKYGCEANMQSEKIKEKYKRTIEEKYGDTNYFKTKNFKSKRLNSLKEHYGVENYFETEEFKSRREEINEKTKKTKLEKYGNENYYNTKKCKDTIIEKYGSFDNFYNLRNEKIKDTVAEKYNSFDNYYNLRNEKSRDTIIEKYGSFDNYYSAKNEKSKENTMRKYKCWHTNQKHIKNFNKLNEDYVRDKFINSCYFNIENFMNFFNISRCTANKYKYVFNITQPSLRSNLKTQRYIYQEIKSNNKLFCVRSILDGKELDIYLPDFKLAIEYNGLMYHSQGYSTWNRFNTPDFNKNYHLDKTNQCLDLGIQLFHIFEGEDLDLWLSMINNKLGLNERIFARKCEIRELSNKDIFNFLSENHIQGYTSSKINLGLFFQNKLVSVMTFSKPRFNKKYEYELIRFCSLKNTSVIGGANKLLKYFIRKYNPKSIISYANRRFSNGSIYETLGFKKIGVSAPNYFYFKDSTELESRNKYQKHKLKSLLSDFNPELTESENMFKNGYRRIYDCGNLVYEWKK